MENSLKKIKKTTKNEMITGSDLEEFVELLSTDAESEDEGKMKCIL